MDIELAKLTAELKVKDQVFEKIELSNKISLSELFEEMCESPFCELVMEGAVIIEV